MSRKAFFTTIFTVLLATSSLTGPAKSGVSIPDTFAGNILTKLVAALNTGDREQWSEFVLLFPKSRDSASVMERRMRLMERLYADLGGIEPISIVDDNEYRIVALVKGIDPDEELEYARLTLDFDPEPPHNWLGVRLMPAENPDEIVPRFDSDDELADFLRYYLDSLTSIDEFSGTALVAKGDRIIFEGAYGQANKRYDIPNRIDTKLNLGSMNKMFTGTAIVQLAEQGKLRFDDTIDKYLPDYPNRDAASKITIDQLLTHTSGLGDYMNDLYNAHWWEVKTVRQLADLIVDKPLEFEPGERFQYSNSGPVILGLIIEKITGMDYYDYIRKYIYEPAGMINSDSYEMDHPVPNLAFGYTKYDYNHEKTDQWYNNLFMHFAKGSPAGGGFSTVEDLFNFSRALTGRKLVSPAYFDTLTTGKVEMGPDIKYAYLFGDERVGPERIIGHNGGAPGINAVLDIYMNSGYTVAVLSNYNRGAMKVSQLLRKALIP